MSRVVFTVIFACVFLGLKAQKVENVRAASSGDQIIVTYDLTGTKPDQRFKVNLYSSHNNFAGPVQNVTGDVGDNVAAGKDKRISWSARNELVNFKGNLSFEVRADLMVVAPVTAPVTSEFKFRDAPSVKRGSVLPINWSGGTSSENVKLELMKNNVPQQTVANTRNTGSYSWSVPADTKAGTYQLKITGSSGTGVSGPFAIKNKIPMLAKVGVPVVVIIAVIAATSGGGGDKNPQPSGEDNLPEPPKPTN